MVAVDDPDPPQEATIETESMGVLRAHTVVVQRLANELFRLPSTRGAQSQERRGSERASVSSVPGLGRWHS